jgi:hypothetical protein
MDKNNSHKTMVQKEERRIRTIHTKQWYKKKRGMDKNNSHKTMVQKEERHGSFSSINAPFGIG